MKLKFFNVLILCCFTVVLLDSCSGVNFSQWRFPYMYSVQQGNYINSQQLAQLQPGMTKEQVTFVVGHPVSQYMFNSSQWQYVFQDYQNNKLANSYIININFDLNGRLSSIESAGTVFTK